MRSACTPTSLLDIGCGSGVVAIAAVLLGFSPVVAVDVDPAAVEATTRNAAANAAANGVEVDARLADGATARLPAVDVTVANISLADVERLLPRLVAPLVVTSGYLDRDRPEVEGWEHVDRREVDGWAADLLRLQQQ